MYVPRRHSRRLLLPPGWVALGFLLLLGCQVLLAHRRQMQVPNVIQLQMPELKSTVSTVNLGDSTLRFDFSYDSRRARAAADTSRRWHDFTLNGSATDSVTMFSALDAIETIRADTVHAGAVRVRFKAGTTYKALVHLLDIIEIDFNKRPGKGDYWFDVRRQAGIFYIITPKAPDLAERRYNLANECQATLTDITISRPVTLSDRLQNMRQPARRPLLLVVVGSMVLLLCASIAQCLWSNPGRRVPF
jgi:hypothetical protein